MAAIGNEDVRGLDVPVHNPLGVCGVQRIDNLGSQLQQLFGGERLAADSVLERLSLQQLHGDEVLAVRFVNLMNSADVRMIERRGGKRFSLKAFTSSGIILHIGRQELQRDMAMQLEVFGFVHHTHPAATELRENAIVRDCLANHLGCVAKRQRTS